jgi:hypothetical protein
MAGRGRGPFGRVLAAAVVCCSPSRCRRRHRSRELSPLPQGHRWRAPPPVTRIPRDGDRSRRFTTAALIRLVLPAQVIAEVPSDGESPVEEGAVGLLNVSWRDPSRLWLRLAAPRDGLVRSPTVRMWPGCRSARRTDSRWRGPLLGRRRENRGPNHGRCGGPAAACIDRPRHYRGCSPPCASLDHRSRFLLLPVPVVLGPCPGPMVLRRGPGGTRPDQR